MHFIMFKCAPAFLLFEILVATFRGADLCCPEIQNQLAAVKLDNEILIDLVRDLHAKLGSSFEWPPSKSVMCPPGFTYLPSAGSCYKAVFESHDWYSAGTKCQGLHPGSHLAVITSAAENIAVKTFLASEISKNAGNTAACVPSYFTGYRDWFWTSGQRLIGNSCKSPFVWKPWSGERLPFNFTSWIPGQPDCFRNMEFCMHFWANGDFRWNDAPCNQSICSLCEYNL